MKIKHILSVAIASATIGALASCDDIKEDDRYLDIPGSETPSTPSELPKRVTLLEEFTGQKCVNCPTAHGIINSLTEAYGDQFIPVSIHPFTPGDAFNYPKGGLFTLANDIGTYYADKWNIAELPTGAVNMTGLTNMGTWAEQVRTAASETTTVSIDVDATYADGTVTATVDLDAAEATKGTLLIWLTESNVKAPQSQPDGSTVNGYIHNHILRDAIGDRDGYAVNLAAGNTDTRTVSLDISATRYKPENLTVVAFIMKDAWRNVIQAGESHVSVDDAQ